MERYKAIVEYKTAYYTFYLPIALAMHVVSPVKPTRMISLCWDRIAWLFKKYCDFDEI